MAADEKAKGTKPAGDFQLETNEKAAKTTVAREQTDPRSAADNTVAQSRPEDDEAATGVLGSGHGDFNPVTATDSQLGRAKLSEDAENERKRIEALPEVPLYNPNAGLTPRVGGPYLDVLELERAETQRAVFENREPNYDDMAGTAGVTLMTAGQVANLHGGSPALAQFIEAHADDDKLGPTPVTTVPMAGTNLDVIEVAEQEKKARQDWDNTKVTSHDQPGTVFTESATRDATRE